MKKLAAWAVSGAAVILTTGLTIAQDDEKPREQQLERELPREEQPGPEARERRSEEGDRERGPRDDDRPRERGPRDGDRPREGGPRDGDRPREGGRPPFPGGPIFGALDRNRDGVLDSEEIDQAIAVLRRMDRNRDGRLTADEIGGPPGREGDRPPRDGGRPPREGDRPPGERGRGPREGDARRGDGPPNREQMMARFIEADADKDGKLSKEEAPERMREGFARIDADGSGFIEKSELEAMVRRFEEGGRGGPPREGEGRRPREGGEREGGERRRPEPE